MSEEKSVRELERELKSARIKERKEASDNATPNRDFSIGLNSSNSKHKDSPESDSIPNTILLPKKKKKMTENRPFY